IDFTKTTKPISFSPVKKKTTFVEEKLVEEENDAAVEPKIPEKQFDEIPVTESKQPDNDNHTKEEVPEKDTREKGWHFTKISTKKANLIQKPVEQSKPEPEPEPEKIKEELPEAILPEEPTIQPVQQANITSLLKSIQLMNSGITLAQTIRLISKAVKELTGSDSVEMCLIDEPKSIIHKFAFEEDSYTVEQFPLTQGLTGTSAIQKKLINLEKPTGDDQFNPKIDQPGNKGLKRIIYFPIVNSSGYTIAVVQAARENKKYDEADTATLDLISGQIESALERSYEVEQMLQSQQLADEKIIQKLIVNDVHPPIRIINSYIELLNEKNLPADIDEVLRMLLKQINSVEDVIRSIFNSTESEIQMELKDTQFNEFIDDILELLSEYCESREVKLYKKIGDGAVVSIDRSKFYTAIYQLIKFACNNSKQDGRIYFSTDKVNNKIEIQIKDEGKGIDEELQNRLLKKSHEAVPETLDSFSLTIAKRIIEAHSGTIAVETSKSDGTKILISLNISGS
ncbi:MAG TPA: GAF domain-containing sensor histidine kinase, partial [Ignavibacteriaceae bacterium]